MLDAFVAAIAYMMALMPGNLDPEALTPWKGYAAFVVSADSRVGMGWGKTAQEAEEKAHAACRRKSLTCADEASITNRPTDKVAVVCCRRPGSSCIISVAETDSKAVENAEAFTEAQEWGNCRIRAIYSARSGFRR